MWRCKKCAIFVIKISLRSGYILTVNKDNNCQLKTQSAKYYPIDIALHYETR